MRPPIRTLLLLCALAVAACGSPSLPEPVHVLESPAGSDTWVEVAAPPAWIGAPPERDGHLRYVFESRSNLRPIATTNARRVAEREVAADVGARLAAVLGESEAVAAGERAARGLVLVERASRDEVLTTRAVPGNTLSTVHALWEVPIADVVAPLPEDLRRRAADTLSAR